MKHEDLTPIERKALVGVLTAASEKNNVTANMMLFVLHTGMRKGEVRKLQWQHINLHRSMILIKDPKGGVDIRIPLSEPTKELLLKQPSAELNRKGVRRPDGYVFPGHNGAMKSGESGVARNLANAAGLPQDFRPFHGLRHYALTELVASSVNIETVRRMAGHKNMSTTLRYLSARDDQLIEAADILGRKVNEAIR